MPPPFSLQSSYVFHNIIEQNILFRSQLLYQIFIFQKRPLKLLEKYEFILEMLFKEKKKNRNTVIKYIILTFINNLYF